MSFKQKTLMIQQPTTNPDPKISCDDEATTTTAKKQTLDLGNGSEIIYFPRFLPFDYSWKFFEYLDTRIPWTRPTVRVFGRSCLQPRETCYVASPGLPELMYSGHKPIAYSRDDYPPLKEILDAVKIVFSLLFDVCSICLQLPDVLQNHFCFSKDHKALPGSKFNSLLLNRYKGGNDNVGWHADDEKLYGPTPEIASVSFGCEREFLLKKRPTKSSKAYGKPGDEPVKKRLKKTETGGEHHSFRLKHGSLLVMRLHSKRLLHSVPKRAKVEATRINPTFRLVL